MVQIGTYRELLSSASFAHLLENINQHEQEQQRRSVSLTKQLSRISSINLGKEEDIQSSLMNIERKEEGTVKWNVYASYLRAGVGLILGLVLIITIFTTHQATILYSNWWLAEWNDDEDHRHRLYNNCTRILNHKMEKIRMMSDIEWNEHRNRRFYTFCG
jgi:hypothetical protein